MLLIQMQSVGIVVLGLCCAQLFAVASELDVRIVGGRKFDIQKAPYQVSIQAYGTHFCGGSIISRTVILTAAHCLIKAMNVAILGVYAGSTSIETGGITKTVKRVITHEFFLSPNLDFDYGLVELDSPLEFSDSVSAIELPKHKERVPEDEVCLVSGWGFTETSSQTTVELRAVEVNILSKERCATSYKFVSKITPRMFCAGWWEGGKDACQDDSGGPLVCSGKLVGIVSWGYGCAQPEYPGVYSNVAYARVWIQQNSGV